MIYVMSDIHGDSASFNKILSMIDLQKSDHLYIIGDVVDRGPDSIAILQHIRKMPRTTLLLGNHEYMMMNVLQDPQNSRKRDIWYSNGGHVTEEQWSQLEPEERTHLLEYIESLPVQLDVEVDGKIYTLVHAAPLERFSELGRYYINQTEYAVWERLGEGTNLPDGKTVIFGHTPTMSLQCTEGNMRFYYGQNRIGIDCGCAYPEYRGQLGCLRLDDMTAYYSLDGVVKWSLRLV